MEINRGNAILKNAYNTKLILLFGGVDLIKFNKNALRREF